MRSVAMVLVLWLASGVCHGGIVDSFGSRWDAAPRTHNGYERSLQGGLRYSVSGGSFETFRNQFSWFATPTVADFQQAVGQAFAAWTAVDPVSRLGTALSFAADLGTSVATGPGFGTLDPTAPKSI